jgi:hypothetical protein
VFAGKQVAWTAIEKPSNARHFGHAHRHALDINTLFLFRKRPKRSGSIPHYAAELAQTAQTAQRE